MAEPMSIDVTGLLRNRQVGDIITIRKIDNGDSINGQWSLGNEDDNAVGTLQIQVTGLPADVNTNAEVTIVKTDRIGELEQWEVQEPVAPVQEPVAEGPVAEALKPDEVDGGRRSRRRRSRRQGGSKKQKKYGGSKKQKKYGGSKKQKKYGGSKKQKKYGGSKKRR